MKTTIILCLTIAASVLGFLLYNAAQEPVLNSFPVEEPDYDSHEKPFLLNLYLFFTLDDNPGCLEIIPQLNQLPAHFKITGILPDHQLLDKRRLYATVKPSFPLKELSRYNKYITYYTPSLMGVSEKGKIYFVRPVIPGDIENTWRFLLTFYQKIYPALLNEEIRRWEDKTNK